MDGLGRKRIADIVAKFHGWESFSDERELEAYVRVAEEVLKWPRDPGYYLPAYNFSVRMHKGQWCLFSRLPGDLEASTPEQKQAVEDWASSNRAKFRG